MPRKMKKPVNPFDVADDNAFLAALDSAIGARMIPEEGIPEEQLAVLGNRLDEINRKLDTNLASPEETFENLMMAVADAQPEKGISLRERVEPLSRHERLFLGVYLFDSATYNDGIEHFFYYDSADLYDAAIEGLREIGAHKVADSAERFVQSVFGRECPRNIEARQAVLDDREEASEEAAEEFRHYARLSEEVTRLLAKWARSNRAHFL